MSTRTAGWDSDGAPRFSDGAGRGAGFAPRRNALLGEGIPTRRMSKRICPAQERSPRRRLPDTAHERKDLPRAETLSSAKASRHGARAKGFAPRRNAPSAKASRHGARAKGFAPRGFAFAPHADERRAAPDRRTAGKTHLRRGRTRDGARAKGFARAGTRPSAKASRHGARAKGFALRRNTPLGEGLSTRRTSERSCPTRERSPRRRPPDTAHERKGLPHAETLPTQKRSPRRRHPDTAHERKDLPRARTLSSAKASRHGARAKGFAPREKALLGESLPTRRTGERICPRGVRPRPTCRRTAGRPRSTDSRKTPLRRGRTHSACGRCRVHSPKKK